MVAPQILVLLVGVRILLGELKTEPIGSVFFVLYGPFVYRFRTRDSQSLKKGSTPLGTVIKGTSCSFSLISFHLILMRTP